MRRVMPTMPEPVCIRRGSTPTLTIRIPYRPDIITGGYITFAQRGAVLFEKSFDDSNVNVGDFQIKVHLTQEETLGLTSVDTLKAQLRFILKYGQTAGSDMYEWPVDDVLKGGEI